MPFEASSVQRSNSQLREQIGTLQEQLDEQGDLQRRINVLDNLDNLDSRTESRRSSQTSSTSAPLSFPKPSTSTREHPRGSTSGCPLWAVRA